MNEPPTVAVLPRPNFRKLRAFERSGYLGHLRSLSVDDRRARFHTITSDDQLARHAAGVNFTRTVFLGAFVEGVLVGVGEVALGTKAEHEAEKAVSVGASFRGRGIGGELTRRVIRIAQNRGAHSVWMFCLPDNTAMRNIARNLRGRLSFHQGTLDARLELTPSTPLTRLEESLEDGVGVARSVSELVFGRVA
jgi:RimJ/RimL family protein N-acetyltransferase